MLIGLTLLAVSAVLVPVTPSTTETSPVPDTELAQMRGGVLLPNGLSVSIGIDLQTRINGVLALHTVYTSDGPNAGIRVFTDGTSSPSTAPGTTVVSRNDGMGPTVVVGRSPAGTTITPSNWGQAITLNLVNGPASDWLTGNGQMAVPVVENGPSVAATSGAITLSRDDNGARVSLVTPTVQVQHLIGQATGVVIANTANNQAIDTISSINVDLQGLPAGLLGGVLMANRIAVDAARIR